MSEYENIAAERLKEIGNQIHLYRRAKQLSAESLGLQINKSKASISKYETGKIAIDILTLCDLADALGVSVEQLLPQHPSRPGVGSPELSAFLRGEDKLYLYHRKNKEIMSSVIKVNVNAEDENNAELFYNVDDVDHYEECQHLYFGQMRCYDMLISLTLVNQYNFIENMVINIIRPMPKTDCYVGMLSGISDQPAYPVATKVVISRKQLARGEQLYDLLTVTREELKMLKTSNRFHVY